MEEIILDFDQFADSYNNDLMKGLCLSGESPSYFAKQRVHYVYEYLKAAGKQTDFITEFGCGIGNNIEFLARYFSESQILGLDVSQESLNMAQRRFKSNPKITFERATTDWPNGQKADLIFVSGVFHHIPPKDCLQNLQRLHKFLKKGAALFIFENNPFNLGTRWVMKRIPFDRGAVLVNPYTLTKQLASLGYCNISIQFYFIFPKFLFFLRFLEKYLRSFPLGAQYCVVGFKEDD